MGQGNRYIYSSAGGAPRPRYILVDEKRWIGETRVHVLNCSMLLLGSEAQQLAIYLG